MTTDELSRRNSPPKSVDADEIARRLERAAIPVQALSLLCQYNSDVRKQDVKMGALTYYHSTVEPPVSLASYLERIARYSECGAEGVLLGLRLVGRCHATAGVTLTRLSAHRLAITGLTLGVKAHMDRFRSNRTVARAGGLQLKELNGLEYAFFRELGYRAIVTQEELDHMERLSARAVRLFQKGLIEDAASCAQAAFCGEPGQWDSASPGQSPPQGGLARVGSAESLQSMDGEHAMYTPALFTADIVQPARAADSSLLCSASRHLGNPKRAVQFKTNADGSIDASSRTMIGQKLASFNFTVDSLPTTGPSLDTTAYSEFETSSRSTRSSVSERQNIWRQRPRPPTDDGPLSHLTS